MLVRTKYELRGHVLCIKYKYCIYITEVYCVCVVMLDAPDDVLLERSQGKLVDPLTGGESTSLTETGATWEVEFTESSKF